MIDITKTDLLTHRECVARARLEGLPVTEHALRVWTRSGQLPMRRIGSKGLIYWPNLVRFITCEDGCDNIRELPQSVGGIRQIGI